MGRYENMDITDTDRPGLTRSTPGQDAFNAVVVIYMVNERAENTQALAMVSKWHISKNQYRVSVVALKMLSDQHAVGAVNIIQDKRCRVVPNRI